VRPLNVSSGAESYSPLQRIFQSCRDWKLLQSESRKRPRWYWPRDRTATPDGAIADEIPFYAEHRFMATLHHSHENGAIAYVKGAPERINAMCDITDEADGPNASRVDWRVELTAA
jgi:magnesium-transporting ATPase (P-type)